MTEPFASPDRPIGGLDLHQAFRDHGPWLLRFLRRWGPPDDADDLLQQTFLRIGSLQDNAAGTIRSPGAYLRRAALNMVRDNARANARRPGCDEGQMTGDDLPGPDPVAELEARDMLRRIEDIVARMPARRREIFLAHRIDGYSYGEIAARTGISIKGVEKQMSRAIAQIDRLAARR